MTVNMLTVNIMTLNEYNRYWFVIIAVFMHYFITSLNNMYVWRIVFKYYKIYMINSKQLRSWFVQSTYVFEYAVEIANTSEECNILIFTEIINNLICRARRTLKICTFIREIGEIWFDTNLFYDIRI